MFPKYGVCLNLNRDTCVLVRVCSICPLKTSVYFLFKCECDVEKEALCVCMCVYLNKYFISKTSLF